VTIFSVAVAKGIFVGFPLFAKALHLEQSWKN